MTFLGKASQSLACRAGMQNYIRYDITLLMLLYTLTITPLYATYTITLLYPLTITLLYALNITLLHNV